MIKSFYRNFVTKKSLINMCAILIQGARLLISGYALKDTLKEFLSPPVVGKELPQKNYQDFANTIAKAQGISNTILLREVTSTSPNAISHRRGLLSKKPQITIPQGCDLSDTQKKFAIAHELGHIKEYHTVIMNGILITNLVLLGIPTIPLTTVGKIAAGSFLTLVGCFKYLEKRADDFAFDTCQPETIHSAFKNLEPGNSLMYRLFFPGNSDRRNKAYFDANRLT